ncbi:MAG: YdcF family protein [Planctomycetaceae bacterium]
MTDSTSSASLHQPSVIRVLLGFGLVSVAVLMLIRILLGRMVAEKIATTLMLPCGILWSLQMCCVALAITSRQRNVATAIFCVWLMYTVCGNGLLADILARSLEDRFTASHPLHEAPFDYVIVLGGGGSQGANLRMQGNGSGDRILLAAQLYHADIARRLICTGKRIAGMDGEGPDPSDIAFDLLTGLGVPGDAIERVGGHNTAEEMLTLRQRFEGRSPRVGLVTSAWHLPRALRLASHNGLTPVPLPADFMSGPDEPWTPGQWISSMIPQAENLLTVARVTKEHLAALVGR